MYHIIFIYSSVDGHLDYFHVLANVNNAAMNIRVHISFQIKSFLQIYAQGLLDHMATLFPVFEGTPIMFSVRREHYHKESWMLKNWCFWTVLLEKMLESPLDCKEIKPVNHKRNQFWIFIGKTDGEPPILWPPDAKNWLTGKDPDAGQDWQQEEKAMTEDEMFGWHHRLDGHESQ